MSRVPINQTLRASVLDRLGPDAARSPQGRAAPALGQSMRDLKQCIRRDLENLLNTRWRCTSWPPNLDELEQSMVNYGIPDFSGAGLGATGRREEFRRILERSIARFEPRLKNVRVEIVDNDEAIDRVLRFRINAVLQAKPLPEQVVFDSALEPLTASFEVRGGSR